MNETYPTIVNALKDGLSEEDFNKITIAGNDPVKIKIEGVTFLCGTLWTDYGDSEINAEQIQKCISTYINDHKTIKNMDWLEVIQTRAEIENGKVAYWQVTLKIGFRIED